MSENIEHKLKFSSPDEEIEFLRSQIALKERELESQSEAPAREEIVRNEIKAYNEKEPGHVLSHSLEMKTHDIEEHVLELTREEETKLDELIRVMEEKGMRNALTIAEKLNRPHLQDDFHRFLVQYFVELGTPPGVKEGTPLFRALRMKLFQVTLLKVGSDGEERPFSELVAAMEQFYRGMLSVVSEGGVSKIGENHFTIEIAQPEDEEEVVFYVAVPRSKEHLFETQLLAVFPDARIVEKKKDYNPFNQHGVTLASYGVETGNAALPIKTFDEFDHDPLNIILNAFSKIKKKGEGAAIQFVFSPAGTMYNKKYNAALEKIRKGVSLKEATQSLGAEMASEVGSVLKSFFVTQKKKDPAVEARENPVDEDLIKKITDKTATPILDTNIRIIASGESERDAENIIVNLESVFNQFNEPSGNGIRFKRVKGSKLSDLIHDFTFRLFDASENLILNTKELTTLFHFPVVSSSVSELKEERSKRAGAPKGVSDVEGVLLGINRHRGEESEVHFAREDRIRHFYIIGQTGTGKTTLLINMINQDIANGDGVCMIDPHGTDIVDILANIPENRMDDVIYFDPAYTARPMGLNMLEYDPAFPEQKTFVVNELFNIFQKLYGGTPESMGPMFEQYFRNATLLVIEDPDSGSTLLEVSRVMSDEAFRKLKLSRCKNPVVVQFWEKIAAQAGGEASLANIVPYITSKFDIFMANDIMRPIIAQEKSAFNFRSIMDEKKILLINLSKGRLGDINSSLLGLIIVGKILMAALSRVDAVEGERSDFYLYIDEFQNITTDSIATILSEARKYRLGLNIAHQFIAQLEEKIRDAVFGNVGSIAAFRVGSEDAEFLEKQFTPTFDASDIMNLENRNAYLKLLVGGQPQDPFNIETVAPLRGNPDIVEKLKELSYRKYGRDRTEIEADIAKRFAT